MKDEKMIWLAIFSLAATTCHCVQQGKIFIPTHTQTSGGSLFLESPEAGDPDPHLNDVAAYNEHADPGNQVKPHELNIFQEPAVEFGPQNSPTKFVHSGELPTGSFGHAPTDDFNALFLKSTVPERPERHQSLFDRSAKTVKHHHHSDGEIYSYDLETDHGISLNSRGHKHGVETKGGYAYTGEDGRIYTIKYAAGRSGMSPRVDQLPTPPPIPGEIIKSLEGNMQAENNGIYNDGSFDPHKYPGSFHYDPSPGSITNDAVDSVNSHNHIYSHINDDSASNNGNPVYTESVIENHIPMGNNNPQNSGNEEKVTDAVNPNSYSGFRSLQAAARIGGVAAPALSRNRFKGAQFLPPVPINAQHVKIGPGSSVLKTAPNIKLVVPSKQALRYEPNSRQKPIIVPSNIQDGY